LSSRAWSFLGGRYPWLLTFLSGKPDNRVRRTEIFSWRGLNGFQSSGKLPLALPAAGEYRKGLGLSFSIVSRRLVSAKGTFIPVLFRAPFWSGWAYVPPWEKVCDYIGGFVFFSAPMQGIVHEKNFWNSQISKGSKLKTRRNILINWAPPNTLGMCCPYLGGVVKV
jgi:hypothetical protein